MCGWVWVRVRVDGDPGSRNEGTDRTGLHVVVMSVLRVGERGSMYQTGHMLLCVLLCALHSVSGGYAASLPLSSAASSHPPAHVERYRRLLTNACNLSVDLASAPQRSRPISPSYPICVRSSCTPPLSPNASDLVHRTCASDMHRRGRCHIESLRSRVPTRRRYCVACLCRAWPSLDLLRCWCTYSSLGRLSRKYRTSPSVPHPRAGHLARSTQVSL